MTNLDAPLLRLMLSLAALADTAWSSVDITSPFLGADIHEEDIVLVAPLPILDLSTVWQVEKAIYAIILWSERHPTRQGE